jgi:CheY-like chemotaxis protein
MKKPVVRIPAASKVLVLEDNEERIRWFALAMRNLQRGPHFTNAACAAIALLDLGEYDFIFLDHDLGILYESGRPGPEGDGCQVAKHMHKTNNPCRNVVIHSWNRVGAKRMEHYLPHAHVIMFGEFNIEVT